MCLDSFRLTIQEREIIDFILYKQPNARGERLEKDRQSDMCDVRTEFGASGSVERYNAPTEERAVFHQDYQADTDRCAIESRNKQWNVS